MRFPRRGFFLPKHPRLLAAALGLAVILAVTISGWLSPRPAPRYAVTDLGVLPGDTRSGASAINDAGDVAGISLSDQGNSPARHVFLYRGGRMVSVGAASGLCRWDLAPAINDRGQVAASSVASPTVDRACLLGGGKRQDLGALPGLPDTFARGLNNQGQVVGNAMSPRGLTTTPLAPRAFLFSGGRMTPLRPPPGHVTVQARGINDAGRIIETTSDGAPGGPFLYDTRSDRWTALTPPPGALFTTARAVNGRGQVVGYMLSQGGIWGPQMRAILWNGGAAADLGTLPGATDSEARAINGSGAVAGTAEFGPSLAGRVADSQLRASNRLRRLFRTDYESHALLWHGGRMDDLNDWIADDSGWMLEEASGINDRGQIVGEGLHHGQERAFLLTPVR